MTLHVMLTAEECALLQSVFRRHPEIARVSLFGLRAKRTARADSEPRPIFHVLATEPRS